jgi:hypothetical protein
MARSVKPQVEYVAQQGMSFNAWTRKAFSSFQAESPAVESKQ